MAAAYVYDDFRVSFTPRADGAYDVRAVDAAGTTTTCTFQVPLDDEQLQQRILGVARSNSRKAATRDIGTAAIDESGVGPNDAAELGTALGSALLGGALGDAYDAARRAAGAQRRGLRLSLSLVQAPGLLSVPWEFLYRRPQFLASQRKTPLVRVLDTGEVAPPPAIGDKVRILGVIASPSDLGPLDVAQEMARVDHALRTVVELGRVELQWLQPATRRRLREVLREGDFHVIHYVGHSDFTAEGEGVLFLEDDDGRAAALDSIELANLLGDVSSLRFVVLNSCEGARTTLTDPYAGVATTLIQLGVPAVCAMQFEISDEAAILFAEVLYTNLIGQQASVDAAVAEARKAIFNEVDHVEFATPVLFVHDPELELFRFDVATAPLPPPPPPSFDDDDDLPVVRTPSPLRRRAPFLVGGAVAAALAIGAAVVIAGRDDPGATADTTPGTSAGREVPVTTLPSSGAVRPRTGFVAMPVLDDGDRDGDGDRNETHLFVVDPADPDRRFDPATDRNHARDSHPTWERTSNRLAFQRSLDGSTGISYVVPGNGRDDDGKQVQALVVPDGGDVAHLPSWSGEAELVYAITDGCAPGPSCEETILRQRFSVSDEVPERGAFLGFRSLDNLAAAGPPEELSSGMTDVVDVAADQSGSGRVAVADAAGLWLISDGAVTMLQPEVLVTAMAFTPDGSALVVSSPQLDGEARVGVFGPDGTLRSVTSVAELDRSLGGQGELVGEFAALSPGSTADRVAALVDRRGDGVPPRLVGLEVLNGVLAVTSSEEPPSWLRDQGLLRGIAV